MRRARSPPGQGPISLLLHPHTLVSGSHDKDQRCRRSVTAAFAAGRESEARIRKFERWRVEV
jgi:alpha/beta superfamily hydrolase